MIKGVLKIYLFIYLNIECLLYTLEIVLTTRNDKQNKQFLLLFSLECPEEQVDSCNKL